jgi:hypothetical protein
MYGYETWSLTLREHHRLRAFKNRVVRRIFGPKRDEVAGGWLKLDNEELRNFVNNQVEEDEMDRTCSTNRGVEERT